MFMGRIQKITVASLIVGAVFSISAQVNGQQFRFRNYSIENNLPDKFVYSISQDNDGYLWLSTGKGCTSSADSIFIRYIIPTHWKPVRPMSFSKIGSG